MTTAVVALDGTAPGDRELLGGKAFSVNSMRSLGMPVPPAFAITTPVCRRFHEAGGKLPEDVILFMVNHKFFDPDAAPEGKQVPVSLEWHAGEKRWAVAGAAREHPSILIFGLLLSIILMGVAATAIANLLHKHRWIGFVGLAIVLYVAVHMIWQGHRSVVMDLNQTPAYNAAVPDPIDIKPDEVAQHNKHR